MFWGFLHKKENLSPSASVASNVRSEPLRCNKTSPETEKPSNFGWGTKSRDDFSRKAEQLQKAKKTKNREKKKKREKERTAFAKMTLEFCAAFFIQGCSGQKSFLLSSMSHLEKPSAAFQPQQLFKFLKISLPTAGFVVVVCLGGVGSLLIFPACTSLCPLASPAVLRPPRSPSPASRPLGSMLQPRTAGTAGARGGGQQWRAGGAEETGGAAAPRPSWEPWKGEGRRP